MRACIEDIVSKALSELVEEGSLPLEEVPAPALERPRDLAHGDWASAVCMRCAKQARMNPREIASILASKLADIDLFKAVEVAGPGFINIRLSDAAWQSVFASARQQASDYGRSSIGGGERVDVEFISSNPTGPMHLGHGRWAALGDAISNVLSFAGYDVTREFYINDAGNQMNVFAESVSSRYLQLHELVGEGLSTVEANARIASEAQEWRSKLPQNCYAGHYVVDIAQDIYDEEGGSWAASDPAERTAAFKEKAYAAVLAHVREVLGRFGLNFDVWFSERTLYEAANDTSPIEDTLAQLDKLGYLYDGEGARWLRTTDFGDDKDRVLVKADGAYTYFAPDIAYHKNKLDRGFTRCIDLLGADHHGYIKRIQSVGYIFGHPGQPEVIIGQMVNLFRDGEAVRMSKRTGEMVTFEELIDEVGVDATRYLMLSRSTDQPIDFDISQAKKQDSSNPVYYVQYAHARICSLLRRAAGEEGTPSELASRLIPADADLSVLTDDAEIDLARKIDEFGSLVESCARDCAPFRLTHYAQELAACFHQFYTRCHILTDDPTLTTARLAACDAARIVLENALGLLGVSAPDRM